MHFAVLNVVSLLIIWNFQFVQSEKSTGTIDRVMPNQVYNSFSKTNDKFTNPGEDLASCQKRKAVCTGTNCEYCLCNELGTFISYKDGCMNKNQSDAFLNGNLFIHNRL